MKIGAVVVGLLVSLLVGPLVAKDPVLPSHEKAIAALPTAGFKDEPIQIPATVIDVGILSYVPYLSYRIGDDRELNVYGDPAAPACVEIGLYRVLLTSDEEKRRCIDYLRRIFPAVDFRGLRLTGGKILTGGVVVEVTTPDSPDAYGGWWVSAYSLPLCHKVAGTSATVSVVSVPNDGSGTSAEWTKSELSRARPSPSGTSGRVYVREFHRKDGSFVRSHTRSK